MKANVVGHKEHALHCAPQPTLGVALPLLPLLSLLQMLPLEVSGDKAFGLCFPLAQAHPLKWLSRISSISEAPCTAKDILGIRAHKTQCSKPRRQFVDLQTSGLGTSSPTLWEWSCRQTQWDTCLCTQETSCSGGASCTPAAQSSSLGSPCIAIRGTQLVLIQLKAGLLGQQTWWCLPLCWAAGCCAGAFPPASCFNPPGFPRGAFLIPADPCWLQSQCRYADLRALTQLASQPTLNTAPTAFSASPMV